MRKVLKKTIKKKPTKHIWNHNCQDSELMLNKKEREVIHR